MELYTNLFETLKVNISGSLARTWYIKVSTSYICTEMSRSTKRLTSSQGSLDGEVDIADFESVQVRSSSLTNEAAKHRISVKPKSRRVSTKRPQGASYLPNVQEESPQKTHEEDQGKLSLWII
ncbi:hypothetical protein MAR_023813 [Mya arenaria]|uniref:DUF4592 domain-containing protein n=1 Tax=Mya arenaria TaxID=6604 RepID=A0ABY7DWX8_MYAAR|nr:hypothetical protein MAR_023813 [Mya arenaria]